MEEVKNERKKYWLKLNKDFLKSPQMKVIKSMPNGKDYIIFYLSLMLESVETVGHLRFTALIPYNNEMLAAVTETNIDIVRSAIKVFCELGLIQIFDDGTIFMPEVPKITGKESESTERVRKFRNKQKEEELEASNKKALLCNTDVTKCNEYIEEEKDKEKEQRDKSKEEEIILIDEFEKLWELYPKKVGKDKAFIKYKKYRTSKGEDYTTFDEVLSGLYKYLAYIKQTSWYSPKDGSTWFNNQSWKDEYNIKEEHIPVCLGEYDIKEATPEEEAELNDLLKDFR